MEFVNELSAFMCFVEDKIKDFSPILKLKLQVLLRCITLSFICLVLRLLDTYRMPQILLLCHCFIHEGVRPSGNLLHCVE